MRAFGSVVRPEGRFDVTLEVSGVDPSIRSVDGVRERYEAAPKMEAAILAVLSRCTCEERECETCQELLYSLPDNAGIPKPIPAPRPSRAVPTIPASLTEPPESLLNRDGGCDRSEAH